MSGVLITIDQMHAYTYVHRPCIHIQPNLLSTHRHTQTQTHLQLLKQLQCSHCQICWKQNRSSSLHHCPVCWLQSESHEFYWWPRYALNCWMLFSLHWNGRQAKDEDQPLLHTQRYGSLLGTGWCSPIDALFLAYLQITEKSYIHITLHSDPLRICTEIHFYGLLSQLHTTAYSSVSCDCYLLKAQRHCLLCSSQWGWGS